eukprot:4821204-Prorocentrum_lima.AAC.1
MCSRPSHPVPVRCCCRFQVPHQRGAPVCKQLLLCGGVYPRMEAERALQKAFRRVACGCAPFARAIG